MGNCHHKFKLLIYVLLLAVLLSCIFILPPVLAVSDSPIKDLEVPPFDMSPELEWSRTFGGSVSDYGRSVRQTSDGGFIIAGLTLSYGVGEEDVYLVKTDSSGYKAWSRTFGGRCLKRNKCVQFLS